ncbi:hypothetical protein [Pelagerythrobacter aerophilus]|uniref:Uncharacterized protein n=1 Tax=Pelagerythrobacter aerophilus TaxID=2306995 RepID=A0A418NGZ8_9SPHN|nr:hypothetical protein [Pelagerythrobacter aerophilus]RIV77923.1 hypothetical protein D2V04_08440 [Pelagerythrobacter aerophilus]
MRAALANPAVAVRFNLSYAKAIAPERWRGKGRFVVGDTTSEAPTWEKLMAEEARLASSKDEPTSGVVLVTGASGFIGSAVIERLGESYT